MCCPMCTSADVTDKSEQALRYKICSMIDVMYKTHRHTCTGNSFELLCVKHSAAMSGMGVYANVPHSSPTHFCNSIVKYTT